MPSSIRNCRDSGRRRDDAATGRGTISRDDSRRSRRDPVDRDGLLLLLRLPLVGNGVRQRQRCRRRRCRRPVLVHAPVDFVARTFPAATFPRRDRATRVHTLGSARADSLALRARFSARRLVAGAAWHRTAWSTETRSRHAPGIETPNPNPSVRASERASVAPRRAGSAFASSPRRRERGAPRVPVPNLGPIPTASITL